MALAFAKEKTRKKSQLVSVDLGGRITKAVHLESTSDGRFVISSYVVLDSPASDGTLPAELLSEHLKTVIRLLGVKTKQLVITIGVNESIMRTVEMPAMPPKDLRKILKINSKAHLQQDFSGYVFDSFVVSAPQEPELSEKSKGEPGHPNRQILLVGAKANLIDDLQGAIKSAGLIPDHVIPGPIGLVNAFERAVPEVFSGEVVALVDIGFKSSTICLLQQGRLILSRVVNIGGDKLTAGLAELMAISYAEAEGIKLGMADEVKTQLEMLVSPLGRELRASIDFFEHQQDKTVTQVYLSGGSAASACIVNALHAELAIPCKTWDASPFLTLSLNNDRAAEFQRVAPQLSVAIGAALTAL